MGVSVLVLGESGSGKSTSLRNFRPGEIGVFNVAGKPLPFRGKLPTADNVGYDVIKRSLAANRFRAYAIDDSQYLMAFANFAKAREKGYGKFTDMAVDFEQLLEAANRTSKDTVVYFLHHTELREDGRVKAKTIGKMLDNQLTVEGLFPIVLLCECDEGRYRFVTTSDGTNPCKAPMGMLEPEIDNDLKAVDAAIRDYWGMAPLEVPRADKP